MEAPGQLCPAAAADPAVDWGKEERGGEAGGHGGAGALGFLKLGLHHGPPQGAPLASGWPPLSASRWGSLGSLTQPPGPQV